MDNLCKSFVSSGDYQELLNAHSVVEALSERMRKLTSSSCWIIGLDIPGSPLSEYIHSIVKVLEDLLLSAFEGTDVNSIAQRGLLLYQLAPDITL